MNRHVPYWPVVYTESCHLPWPCVYCWSCGGRSETPVRASSSWECSEIYYLLIHTLTEHTPKDTNSTLLTHELHSLMPMNHFLKKNIPPPILHSAFLWFHILCQIDKVLSVQPNKETVFFPGIMRFAFLSLGEKGNEMMVDVLLPLPVTLPFSLLSNMKSILRNSEHFGFSISEMGFQEPCLFF